MSEQGIYIVAVDMDRAEQNLQLEICTMINAVRGVVSCIILKNCINLYIHDIEMIMVLKQYTLCLLYMLKTSFTDLILMVLW